MSMPQPIHVALVGSTPDDVAKATKHFRLSSPGIGPPYLAAVNGTPHPSVAAVNELPQGLITLWVCLDPLSHTVAQQLHSRDKLRPGYGRGYYGELLPEACVLIEGTGQQRAKQLADCSAEIRRAWYASS